ncbi:MAG: undecaprenyl/decaprenyl-phosphate alpha-N-acetylglucosaminyl 1-phosphate transferase [Candidatus Riflebacteria bacterium]|nr:undecaprenyl/decaprenyl-phosphate alpha-N-acetylglucosaminyl 1-phosphate transferase [Candidatus Riflebacteria bacterium]
MRDILMPFMIAWIAGLMLVPLVRRVALRLGLVDRPNRRKIHVHPIPRVGGIAIYLASCLGALPFLCDSEKIRGVLIASTFIFMVGLLDDILDLPAKVKLAGQIIAVLLLFLFHVRIDFITDFLSGSGHIALGLLAYPLTLLWVIGLTNTINLIDGVDGLAGGIVFIALATLLAVRLITPHTQDLEVIKSVLVLTAAIMGSLLAFLRYNVFPAVIFMGDAGAYFLGFIVAALAIAGAAKGSILLPLVIPLIALGLPVLDVILTIFRRFLRRVHIFQADKEHLHHKMLRLGFSQADTTRFLWMISTCFGLLAILMSGVSHRGLASMVTLFLVLMLVASAAFFMNRVNKGGS